MNSRSINCNHLNGFSFYSRCIFSLNMFLGLKSVAKDLKMDLGRVVVITAKSKSENSLSFRAPIGAARRRSVGRSVGLDSWSRPPITRRSLIDRSTKSTESSKTEVMFITKETRRGTKSKKCPEIDSQVALQHFKGGLFTRVITCTENSTTYFINLLYSLLIKIESSKVWICFLNCVNERKNSGTKSSQTKQRCRCQKHLQTLHFEYRILSLDII